MKLAAGLLGLLLTLAAAPAHPVDFEGGRATERRSVERAREARETKDGILAAHEGKERGRTMELYVAEARVVEPIHEGLFKQEAIRKKAMDLVGEAAEKARQQGLADGYSSIYFDRATAEKITARTIRDNRAEIEAWQRDGSRNELEISVRDHGEAVGEVLPENVEQLKPRDRQTEVSRGSIVRLVKEGKDRYYIASSHPLDGVVDYSAGYESDKRHFDFGHKGFAGELERDLILVQVHEFGAEIGKGRRSAKWWTAPQQVEMLRSVEEMRQRLALLPTWGERDGLSITLIPKGTHVEYERGIAGRQYQEVSSPEGRKEQRLFEGGGIQYRFKVFDKAWIRSEESWPHRP